MRGKTWIVAICSFLFWVGIVWANGININTASVEELTTLPYIGPKVAQRIVQYRQEHGPFKNVEELVKVKGIGLKRLEKIKPLVSVED